MIVASATRSRGIGGGDDTHLGLRLGKTDVDDRNQTRAIGTFSEQVPGLACTEGHGACRGEGGTFDGSDVCVTAGGHIHRQHRSRQPRPCRDLVRKRAAEADTEERIDHEVDRLG